MSAQIHFLLEQALRFIGQDNLSSAELFLNQALKIQANHSDALNLLSVIRSALGDYELALNLVNRAIDSNKKNAVAHNNKGNILLAQGRACDAIEAYKISLKIIPNYADAYGNLANAYQDIGDCHEAINCYKKAISLDPRNAEFYCNLGNAFWKLNAYQDAINSYEMVLRINPNHASAYFYLGQLQLMMGLFKEGWRGYEWRWFAKKDSPKPLATKKTIWHGEPFNGTLYVWGEQGIGDQILHGSMLADLRRYPQNKIISLDAKLLPIFQRSFPDFKFIQRGTDLDDSVYDQQISLASLGKFFRNNLTDFRQSSTSYLNEKKNLIEFLPKKKAGKEVYCGISWKSSNSEIGKFKSIDLAELLQPFKENDDLKFINLQYGDINSEINNISENLGVEILSIEGVDLYSDLDSTLSLIGECDIVITTSNTVAHMAGSIGKESLLILPFSLGRFWYWHDIDGVSLWYPSIKIFRQEKQGDWSAPIQAIKSYLESRLAS